MTFAANRYRLSAHETAGVRSGLRKLRRISGDCARSSAPLFGTGWRNTCGTNPPRPAGVASSGSRECNYALLACPTDATKKSNIDQRLADAHITPLWYPEGEHEHVDQVLALLLD